MSVTRPCIVDAADLLLVAQGAYIASHDMYLDDVATSVEVRVELSAAIMRVLAAAGVSLEQLEALIELDG